MPYPVQAVAGMPLSLLHSAAYSAAGALLKMPWHLNMGNDIYGAGASLDLASGSLSLPLPGVPLVWACLLPVPLMLLTLLLPLGFITSMTRRSGDRPGGLVASGNTAQN
jgi:hypothetical protein